MKIRNAGLWWALFLLVAGVFLLLKNLGLFGIWGDAAWGGLFAALGLAFLVWFVIDVRQWWRAIPGFILLSVGALILAQWRQINLGTWQASLILFGIALGFWAVLLVHVENWWAAIPAGVLTVVGILSGVQTMLTPTLWLAAFMLGLALVFALMYFLRERETRWAAFPAVALALVSASLLASTATRRQEVVRWWPVLLLTAGLFLLIGTLQKPAPATPATAAKKKGAAPPLKTKPASKPAVETPAPSHETPPTPTPAAAPAAEEKPIDIYELLKQQPPEPAPETTPAEPPAGGPATAGPAAPPQPNTPAE